MTNEEVLEGGRKLPLVEDFYTIQGEGFHTGKPAYFIRLGGCDVGCGTIVRINPVPAVFEPSPLLKVFGGEIEAVRTDGKKDEFVPEHSMFRVEIVPDEKISFQSGRTLRVLVRNREILFDKLVVYILNFLRQEF